jgi:hypothetical protein
MSQESRSSVDPIDQAPPIDRRGSERHAFEPGSAWLAVRDNCPGQPPAAVRDISMTGLALAVKEPLRLGSVFVVTLQNQERRLARLLPVRVMHATQASPDEWVVGCQFVRKLTFPELQALLGGVQIAAAE